MTFYEWATAFAFYYRQEVEPQTKNFSKDYWSKTDHKKFERIEQIIKNRE